MTRFQAWIERILPLSILVLALVAAPTMIFSREGLPRLRTLEKELQSVEEENSKLNVEISQLKARTVRLRDDPAALEQMARDDLGLVRPNEIVLQFTK